MGGDFTVGVSYTDGEDAASDLEFSGYNVAGQYSYPLSKRTSVYAGVGYTAVKAETKAVETELESIKAMTGLVHKF